MRIADFGGDVHNAEEGRPHDVLVDFEDQPVQRVQIKHRTNGHFDLSVKDDSGCKRLARSVAAYALSTDSGQTFYVIPKKALGGRTGVTITGRRRKRRARDHFEPEDYLERWDYFTGKSQSEVTSGLVKVRAD